MFDPTITLGAVLNAGVLLIGFVVAFTRIGGRIDLLAQRLVAVEESVKQSRAITERIAVIETRQATHGQLIAISQGEVADLRHGRGFIQRGQHGGVDGEY